MTERLRSDLRAAMKAQDRARRETVRLILASAHNAEVEKRSTLTDDEMFAVMRKQSRMRREAIEAYEKGGRADLASVERTELGIIESYLPEQLDRAAITQRVAAAIAETGATSPKDQGRVMQRLMGELRGKADGKVVAEVVAELLAKG